MVVSHEHRYVFIQTPNTASSAIGSALCNQYGGEQILKKHAGLDDFLAQASADESAYFSFSGVRNPMDVAVSRFLQRKFEKRNLNKYHEEQTRFIHDTGGDFGAYFREFILTDNDESRGLAMVPIDWRSDSFQSIDYIYRYENLSEDFPTILEKLGIRPLRKLKVRNATEGKSDFLEFYDEATLDLAYEKFFPYLDHWGYEVPAHIREKCGG